MSTVTKYVPSTRVPVRFGSLFPKSLFHIVDERSRGIRKSRDASVYRLSTKGFYAENIVTGEAVVLDWNDSVQPLKLEEVK